MNSAIDSIIDAIENNMLKKALELCDKNLKKWPGNAQITSLKSLALWYSGYEKEAKKLASFVTQKLPKDHFTISIIERVLEYMDDFESIASLCENALKYDYDVRIAEKLFFAYLKLQATKKLYAIACKLYNVSKNQLYLYWAIVGLILESRCQENENSTVITELAKRILQKIDFPLFNVKLDTEYKNLNVTICELANDHLGILKSLNLKAKMDSSDYTLLSIKSYQSLNDYENAKRKSISHFESSSFIDSSIWLSFLGILDKIQDGLSLAKKLLDNFESKGDLRGIKIAALELKILYPEAFSESVADMLFNFAVDLHCKPSTFNDIIYFLKKMNPDDKILFYRKITDYINSTKPVEDISAKALYLHLHRYLSSISTSKLCIDNGIELLLENFYTKFSMVKCDDGAHYSLALYRCLCQVDHCCSNDNGNFSKLIELLENYYLIFPDNYVFGIILLFANLKLGLFNRSHKLFKNLEIKCLQLDTLGYLMSDHVLNFLALAECESFCSESLSLYSSNRRDTWALICQSMETHSFISVLDFCEFYNRLEKSIQNICIETNFVKINILKHPLKDVVRNFSSERMEKALKTLSYALEPSIDNRDYKIFDTIDATGNLKNNIISLNQFKIDEALYYLMFSKFLLLHSNTDYILKLHENVIPTLAHHKTILTKIMFEPLCENDLAFNITNCADSLVESTISEINNYYNQFIKYELFEIISKSFISFKELLLISILKLQDLKIASISSHSVIVHLKSKLTLMESAIYNFIESLENVNEEHLNALKNILKNFSSLNSDELLHK